MTREERIAQMVGWGYSREFAERYVPMTIAEARERGLATRKYQSELTGLVNRKTKR
jgi:hypothetical protein